MEGMVNQQEAFDRVCAIKRGVRDTIGTELSHEFRSSQTFQAYTAMCGEAQWAYEDGELDEPLITMLEEYAGRVIGLWRAGLTH
jgi:hypothetical protein